MEPAETKLFHRLLRVDHSPFIQDRPSSKQFVGKKNKKHTEFLCKIKSTSPKENVNEKVK